MNKIEIKVGNKPVFLNIRDEADESVFAEVFKQHEYRVAEEYIRDLKNGVIVDVGAHAGFFSVFAKALNPAARLIAIEPEPGNIAALAENFKLNGIDNFEIVAGALGGDSGRRNLALAKDSHNHRLLARKEQKNTETLVVNSWSLPELVKKCIIERIGLLKMDIEGGEYEVFDSLNAEDFSKISSIILEYHNGRLGSGNEIEEQLRENGFGVQIFPSKFDNKMGFIFARNKRT